MIHFNVAVCLDSSLEYMRQSALSHDISGDGPFTKRCHAWLEQHCGSQKVLLTTSGTAALEMAACLCDLKPGDEVIMPSFTFSSTANAFIAQGARAVFVDVRPDTLNIDEEKIEAAITDRTRAICVMHYGGVSCEMDRIMEIARRHSLKVVEDAAQALMATYKGKALGTIGDFGCLSFHSTKNYTMGEGGALLIRDEQYNEKAEILREKGTDRSKFYRGEIDKYTWVDYGSSFLPSDMNAAYLWGQLEVADSILDSRLATWNEYKEQFADLQERGLVELPVVPDGCKHNAHIFYLKLKDLAERDALIAHLKERDIKAVFHYIPLHSAPAGIAHGRFDGEDEFTTKESERLVRLPLYYDMAERDRRAVIDGVRDFFEGR